MKSFRVFRRYPNGYVSYLKQKAVNKYRKLFRRPTGERQYLQRKKVYAIAKRLNFASAFNYPGNSNRTRSLSLRSFAKQTSGLRKSNYFIDQFRGALQDMYHSDRRKNLPWNSDLDVLTLQARNILRKEEEERARPVFDYFNRQFENETEPNASLKAAKEEGN